MNASIKFCFSRFTAGM
ncbi:peptide IlvX [Citrobacter tructae]